MSAKSLLPSTTAGIYPENFPENFFLSRRRFVLTVALAFLMLAGFGLRVAYLSGESFGEDELNKLETVADYRANGLSGRNGEHPFLMKGLQMASITAAEKWNDFAAPENRISDEFALRLPTALIGTLTILLLFLLTKELFGADIGLFAAALWAIEPTAVGFDRIAKEDSFLLCFFLLTAVFWLRGQTAAERGKKNWFKYTLLSTVAFAAMLASKYLPHLIGILGAYYIIFQSIPATKWRLGKMRWLTFFIVAGVCFLIFNPTILIPATWHEMLTFSGEKRIAHNSYEYCGTLYQNKVTAWLAGVPWTFYYVFILVKTSLSTLVFALFGVPFLFRRKLGDGRYFLFFWALLWFLPFTVIGGKFTRYFTVVEPLILIAAAVGFYFLMKWLTDRFFRRGKFADVFQVVFFAVLMLAPPVYNSLSIAPHFRLFTNTFGGGTSNEGFYFPHDEFYDASTREIISAIAGRARPNALVANEAPGLYDYYDDKIGRKDLQFVSLSDKTDVEKLSVGDFIVAARGRRYFSNAAYYEYLENHTAPIAEIKAGETISARIYQLDETTLQAIREINNRE